MKTEQEKAEQIAPVLKRACELRIALFETIAELERMLAGDLKPEPYRQRVEELLCEWIDNYSLDAETGEGIEAEDALGLLSDIAERTVDVA